MIPRETHQALSAAPILGFFELFAHYVVETLVADLPFAEDQVQAASN